MVKAEPDGDERLENLQELVTLGLRYDHHDSTRRNREAY
jgi:hypothetical protein